MALTRIDYHFFRGRAASLDTSSCVALNPSKTPGSLVLAGSSAVKDSLSSQVACKLALEHFVDGVLEYFDRKNAPSGAEQAKNGAAGWVEEVSLDVLEAAFKNANSSVYNFAHKLAAGGKMASSLIGLVVQDRVIAAGRVGVGSAYLHREGELYPFFEATTQPRNGDAYATFIGANSIVAVELASVPVEPGDVLYVFSTFLDPIREKAFAALIAQDSNTGNPCENMVMKLFDETEGLAFAMRACIGPEAIYLPLEVAV